MIKESELKILRREDRFYPQLLGSINDPPERLYYRGELDENSFSECLSVVGSRRMTSYGRRICELFTTSAVKAGISIVSGFAVGIDITALKVILAVRKELLQLGIADQSFRPIIVLPSGFGWVSPIENLRYVDRFLEVGGIFLSEYDYAHPAFKWTYPRRNRIITGISRATLLVEAEMESGSMNSAQHCLRYGRKLFVVPGDIDRKGSAGCNQLIKQGAEIVTSPNDLLVYYNKSDPDDRKRGRLKKREDLSPLQNRIVMKLLYTSLTIDQLAREFEMDISTLSVEISILQLKDLIFNQEGKYRAR